MIRQLRRSIMKKIAVVSPHESRALCGVNFLAEQNIIKKYNKLMRDRILEIIESAGESPSWRALNKNQFGALQFHSANNR